MLSKAGGLCPAQLPVGQGALAGVNLEPGPDAWLVEETERKEKYYFTAIKGTSRPRCKYSHIMRESV